MTINNETLLAFLKRVAGMPYGVILWKELDDDERVVALLLCDQGFLKQDMDAPIAVDSNAENLRAARFRLTFAGYENLGKLNYYLEKPEQHLPNAMHAKISDEEPVEVLHEGTFGWALVRLKAGFRVCRGSGWNGKGMWIELQTPTDQSKMTQPYIYMKTAQDMLVPWNCSQSDMLATDWEISPDTEVQS